MKTETRLVLVPVRLPDDLNLEFKKKLLSDPTYRSAQDFFMQQVLRYLADELREEKN